MGISSSTESGDQKTWCKPHDSIGGFLFTVGVGVADLSSRPSLGLVDQGDPHFFPSSPGQQFAGLLLSFNKCHGSSWIYHEKPYLWASGSINPPCLDGFIGIMISKTIGFRGTRHFQTHPRCFSPENSIHSGFSPPKTRPPRRDGARRGGLPGRCAARTRVPWWPWRRRLCRWEMRWENPLWMEVSSWENLWKSMNIIFRWRFLAGISSSVSGWIVQQVTIKSARGKLKWWTWQRLSQR